jgi:hypothetical protein
MFECRVSLTNTSRHTLEIVPGGWFRLEVLAPGYFMTSGATDPRTTIGPGETVSQSARLWLEEVKKGPVTLRCTLLRLERAR